ncbi:MAG TPA: M20/M25/M40 family metallo-hydrolase [Bryobacteraceae bacterium]|nr:M20/M25/M40 family metallo-hydrolase [Bryobacteraceae bacterium]
MRKRRSRFRNYGQVSRPPASLPGALELEVTSQIYRIDMNTWKTALLIPVVMVLIFVPLPSRAQGVLDAGPADVRIAAALEQVSPERIRSTIEKLVSFGTRSTLSAQDPASIAAGHGIGAARQWIRSQFESYSRDCGGCLEVETDSFTEAPAERIPQPTEITSVYAVLRGTDPQAARRMVLVTGHYDSRNSDNFDVSGAAPGANDDASGTAVSLECARVLSKLKFPATIVFLTVAGEEQGLNGSKHFAQLAKQEGWNLEAVLNNDIVGGDRSPQQDPSVVRVFSEGVPVAADDKDLRLMRNLGGESDSISRELARYIAAVGRSYKPGVQPMLVFRLDRYLRGGDHYSFNQQGFAAVRFTELREDFDHQHQNIRTENGREYGDLPKFVNFDFVASVARLNAATLASLASAPAPPAKVRLLTKELENDSTLSWEPSPSAARYEVLWRATTDAEWNHAQDAGSAARATLRQSKDNVIFAVRAVDKDGHRSLPVVPLPER